MKNAIKGIIGGKDMNIQTSTIVKGGIIGGSCITGYVIHKTLKNSNIPSIISLPIGLGTTAGLTMLGLKTAEMVGARNRCKNHLPLKVNDLKYLLATTNEYIIKEHVEANNIDLEESLKNMDIDEFINYYGNITHEMCQIFLTVENKPMSVKCDESVEKNPEEENNVMEEENIEENIEEEQEKEEDSLFVKDFRKLFQRRLNTNNEFGKELWSSLINTVWYNNRANESVEYRFTFKEAGELITSMLGHGEYTDWYCSITDSMVGKSISKSLSNKGWKYRVITTEDPAYETHVDGNEDHIIGKASDDMAIIDIDTIN